MGGVCEVKSPQSALKLMALDSPIHQLTVGPTVNPAVFPCSASEPFTRTEAAGGLTVTLTWVALGLLPQEATNVRAAVASGITNHRIGCILAMVASYIGGGK